MTPITMYCTACGREHAPSLGASAGRCSCGNAAFASYPPSFSRPSGETHFIDTTPGQRTIGAFDPPDTAA